MQFYLDQKIYFKICQNEIYKFIKIKKRVNIFSLNFVDFLYFLKFLKNVGYFYFTFFFKKNKLSKKKYDILINNFFGFDNNKVNDFPKIENIAKKKIKIAVLLKEKTVIDYKKKFQKNSQKLAENNDLYKFKLSFRNMSPKSKKCLKYYLINFFKNPILYSIVLQFIVTYEYYYQLFKYLGIKIYANSILDMISLQKTGIKGFRCNKYFFQHSYFEKTVFKSAK